MALMFFVGMLVGLLLALALAAAMKKACEEERKRTLADVKSRRHECLKAYRRGKAWMYLGD